jgi:hypothetical protein
MIRASFSYTMRAADDVRMFAVLDGGGLLGCRLLLPRLGADARRRAGAGVGRAGDRRRPVDVAFAGVLRFADDVLGRVDAGMALTDRYELEVVGEDGTLLLRDPWHCFEAGIEWHHDGELERIEIERADSRLQLQNMNAAIAGSEAPLLGRDETVGRARSRRCSPRRPDPGRKRETRRPVQCELRVGIPLHHGEYVARIPPTCWINFMAG